MAVEVEVILELGLFGGPLILDEFDDFHGGFEARGGRGLRIAQNLSESVACEPAEIAEFIEQDLSAILPGCEESAGESRVVPGPKVDCASMDPAPFGGGGDGSSLDAGFQDFALNGRQGVE